MHCVLNLNLYSAEVLVSQVNDSQGRMFCGPTVLHTTLIMQVQGQILSHARLPLINKPEQFCYVLPIGIGVSGGHVHKRPLQGTKSNQICIGHIHMVGKCKCSEMLVIGWSNSYTSDPEIQNTEHGTWTFLQPLTAQEQPSSLLAETRVLFEQ